MCLMQCHAERSDTCAVRDLPSKSCGEHLYDYRRDPHLHWRAGASVAIAQGDIK